MAAWISVGWQRPADHGRRGIANVAVLNSETLPTFTFLRPDGAAEVLALPEEASRIRAVADHLRTRLPAGAVVGLMYRTGPDLVVNWLAAILAGLEPLVMQYMTEKQTRDYWEKSVRNTVETAALRAVLADEASLALGLGAIVPTIAQSELAALPPASGEGFAIDRFAILQLSSGTTGHRKGIRFDGAALDRHVRDYNKVLALDPAVDRIVSWLPLYHDMGYVACFVMPLVLGIDTIMMDPVDWVRRPEMLFDAIERYRGTIAYMPNFGYEMLSRGTARHLPTMRWWISCSEPVYPETARKFVAAVGTAPETFAPCYAMAENIFAVTIRPGLHTRVIDDVEVASCGHAIPGVELKTVDGQIWVRSPTSLAAYIGGGDIRDADGYYPTGDLGEIVDGELFVTGRKQDLVIQAGRKFMLSDIDLVLNRLRPEVRGRAAAVQVFDERLGTQKPVMLIEAADFLMREDQAELQDALRAELNIDQIDVDYVPPRFLTKTSSGKFNRKLSARHWELAKAAQASGGRGRADPLAELEAAFPNADRAVPVIETLDSLSLTLLRIILNGARVPYDGDKSLDNYVAILSATREEVPEEAGEIIRIISLIDRLAMGEFTQAHADRLAQAWGVPVSFEHVCLPPSPIILSDLVFHDWFEPRLDPEPFSAVDDAFDKLRGASLILMDDRAEMAFPPRQVYAALSHNLERAADADYVSVRWQRYPLRHHELPLTVISGADLSLDARTATQDMLTRALGVPIFRLAQFQDFAAFTESWELRPLDATGGRANADPDDIVTGLINWTAARAQPLRRVPGIPETKVDISDLAHFCSGYVNHEAVGKVLDRFDRFVIAGQRASAPFVEREIARRRKSFQRVGSFAPEALAALPEPYDCVLICGAMGSFQIDGPAFSLMHDGSGTDARGLPDDDPLMALRYAANKVEGAKSRTDWYSPTPIEQGAARRQASQPGNERRAKRIALMIAATDLLTSEPELDYISVFKRLVDEGQDQNEVRVALRQLYEKDEDGNRRIRKVPPRILVSALERRDRQSNAEQRTGPEKIGPKKIGREKTARAAVNRAPAASEPRSKVALRRMQRVARRGAERRAGGAE